MTFPGGLGCRGPGVQEQPAAAEGVVQRQACPVRCGHPGLGDLTAGGPGAGAGLQTVGVVRDGDPVGVLQPLAEGPDPVQDRHDAVTDAGDREAPLGDEPSDEHRTPGDLFDVGFSLGLVAVEDRLRKFAAQYGLQLPAQVGRVPDPGGHALSDPRWHGVRGVARQEDPADPEAGREADVMAVDRRPQDLDLVAAYAVPADHLMDGLVGRQVRLVVARQDRELPPVVAERGRAVHRGPVRVAAEAQPVVVRPGLEHLGVDDHPAVLVRPSLVANVELGPGEAGSAVGRDDVGRAEPSQRVAHGVHQGQLDAFRVLLDTQALVAQQHLDIRVAVRARAQHLLQGRLVEEHLRRMAMAARGGAGADEGAAARVDEVERALGQHVPLQPLGQAGALPDPYDLLVRGDRPGPGEDLGVALHDDHPQARRTEQIRGGHTGRPVPDHRHVVRAVTGSDPTHRTTSLSSSPLRLLL